MHSSILAELEAIHARDLVQSILENSITSSIVNHLDTTLLQGISIISGAGYGSRSC